MIIKIERWKRSEPTLKMKWYRFLQPYAGLVDSMIAICTFSQVISNLQLNVSEKHMEAYLQFLKTMTPEERIKFQTQKS